MVMGLWRQAGFAPNSGSRFCNRSKDRVALFCGIEHIKQALSSR